MADDDVLANIQQLSAEEHELYERHRAGGTPRPTTSTAGWKSFRCDSTSAGICFGSVAPGGSTAMTRRRRMLATSRPSRAISSSATPRR